MGAFDSLGADSIISWLLAGLLVVLVAVCGYFAKEALKKIDKIYDRLNSISEIVAQQEVKNSDNDKVHQKIDETLNNHEGRIKTIETHVSTIGTEHSLFHKGQLK